MADRIFQKSAGLSHAKGSGSSAKLGFADYSVLRYPETLGQPDQRSYTAFFINVRRETLKEGGEPVSAEVQNKLNEERRLENRILPEDEKAEERVSNALGFGLAIGGAKIGVGAGNSMVGKALLGIGGVAAAGAIAPALVEFVNVGDRGGDRAARNEARQIVQLNKMIAIAMVKPPSASYKAGWKNADLGTISRLVGENQINLGDALDSIITLDPEDLNKATGGLLNPLMFKSLGNLDILGLGDVKGIAEKSLSTVLNPFKEQLFDSMGFRTFTFEYSFLPKSRTEAYRVKEIIDNFKYYMHSDVSSKSSYWMTYPAEFNIKYYYNGKENDFLPRISTCVLTDVQTDYGAGEDFVVFKPHSEGNETGVPTEIHLKLQFTEMELLTRSRIKQGY